MKKFHTIGEEEERAVLHIMRAGLPLSRYVATHPFGGNEVSAFEHNFAGTLGVKHAVAVNSATSGLLAACMAIDVQPGDEVIVSPLTMSATAAAPHVLGARITFCDVDDRYCMDPKKLGELISQYTKAVIVTNLFGAPAQLRAIRNMCDHYGVTMIEDNAQAIMAKENGIYTGTIGHMGVFSFNYHKHMQCGEGGAVVTNDELTYNRLLWAMNHGEMRSGRVGLNLRLSELHAAILNVQLRKLPEIVRRRQEIGEMLTTEVMKRDEAGHFHCPSPGLGNEHVYYAWSAYVDDTDHLSSAREAARRYGWNRHLSFGYTCINTLEWGDKHQACPVANVMAYKTVLFETCTWDPTDGEVVKLAQIITDKK